MRRSSGRLAEVVCMCVLGPMCLLIMRPVIIYCRFLLISPSKSLDLHLRPKRDRSRLGTLKVSIWSSEWDQKGDPKETHSRPKGDLIATSEAISLFLAISVTPQSSPSMDDRQDFGSEWAIELQPRRGRDNSSRCRSGARQIAISASQWAANP
jgi:hypothetical protein